MTITVSLGRAVGQLPKLTGITVDEAQDRILNANMAFGKATKAFSETVPEGIVIASDPKAGSTLRFGTIVDLVVSKGRAPDPGRQLGRQERRRRRAGAPERGPEGRRLPAVLQHASPRASSSPRHPKSGTLFKGDTVTLLVSLGPQLVEVPNVVASGVDDATAALQAAGFVVDDAGGPGLHRPWLRLLDGPRGRHRAAHRLDGHPLPRVTPAATRRGSLLATGALLLTTASWGSTFFLIKDLLERVPTLDFLAVRFAIAGLVMFAVAHRAVLALPREVLRRAVLVGGIYGIAQILQTAGLAHTAASVSGFITGMYVVCTPLLAALLLKTRITADHLGRGGAGHGRARRAHARTASRSGTARRSPSSPRCSTPCTSSRSARGRRPGTRSACRSSSCW